MMYRINQNQNVFKNYSNKNLINYLCYLHRFLSSSILIKLCKLVVLPMVLFLSCSIDDRVDSLRIEPIFIENPARSVKVAIIYVESDETLSKSSYDLDEAKFIDYLNGYYFHRLNIGLELETSKSLVNEDLYDLRDNEGSESTTFFKQSQGSYEKNKINIYIIKRCNMTGIAGIGRNQRVLLTDENMFTSTSPHEIGHALGLFHTHEPRNIMNTKDKKMRVYFNKNQEEIIKRKIDEINLRDSSNN